MCFRCRLNYKYWGEGTSFRFAFSSGISRPGEEDKKQHIMKRNTYSFYFVRTPEETGQVQFCRNHLLLWQFLREMGCTVAGNLLFKVSLNIIRFYCETNPFFKYKTDYYLSHTKASTPHYFNIWSPYIKVWVVKLRTSLVKGSSLCFTLWVWT